jgi:hypothetical protein
MSSFNIMLVSQWFSKWNCLNLKISICLLLNLTINYKIFSPTRVDYFLLNEWTEIKPIWRMLDLDFFHNNHTCFDVICATCNIHVMMSFSMYHKKIKIISSKRLCSVVKIKHYSSKHLFIWVEPRPKNSQIPLLSLY